MSTSHAANVSPTEKGLAFPPQLLERMQIYWAKVCRAFTDTRGNVQNPVPRKEFHKLLRYIGCDISDADFEKIAEAYDVNRDGKVDYRAILKVVEVQIFPKNTGGGISLSMTPTTFKPERPSGRAKQFKDLSASWNNVYHQSGDPYNGGRPMLSSVMQGRFYYEAPKPISPREFPRTASTRQSLNVLMDDARHQPLVKSLLEGEYYLERSPGRLTARTTINRPDFVAFNRKTQKDYSRTARPARPFTAPASRTRLSSPGALSPFSKASRRDAAPAPSFNVFRPYQQPVPDKKARRLQTEALLSARAQTAPPAAHPSSFSPHHRDLLQQGPTGPARPADRATGPGPNLKLQRPVTASPARRRSDHPEPRTGPPLQPEPEHAPEAGPSGSESHRSAMKSARSGVTGSTRDREGWASILTPRVQRIEKDALEAATAFARRRPSERRTPRPQIPHCPYPVSPPQTARGDHSTLRR